VLAPAVTRLADQERVFRAQLAVVASLWSSLILILTPPQPPPSSLASGSSFGGFCLEVARKLVQTAPSQTADGTAQASRPGPGRAVCFDRHRARAETPGHHPPRGGPDLNSGLASVLSAGHVIAVWRCAVVRPFGGGGRGRGPAAGTGRHRREFSLDHAAGRIRDRSGSAAWSASWRLVLCWRQRLCDGTRDC